jgi:hypothetical protein
MLLEEVDMLPVQFHSIGPDDILRLIADRVSEHKTLEYKQKLATGNREETAEFLADISSFANASGGDILFGISDERDEEGRATGIPSRIVPLQIVNSSSECNRIEQLIQTGVEPKLPVVQVRAVDVPQHGVVIIVRVGRSWLAPHMVTYGNRSRFYTRNSSTGKVQLDVHQIGAAFALQRSIGDRFRAWKSNRIAVALSGDGPVRLEGPQLLYHFVPAAALADDGHAHPRVFEVSRLYNPMSLSINSWRYNADGLLCSSIKTQGERQSYLQVFRDGSLEYGDSYCFESSSGLNVRGVPFESKIVQAFGAAMALLKHLEVSEPVFVSLTLIGMKGRAMSLSVFETSHPFDRDLILCSDVLVQNLSDVMPYSAALLPIVNSVWQSAGRHGSPYVDSNGRWQPVMV